MAATKRATTHERYGAMLARLSTQAMALDRLIARLDSRPDPSPAIQEANLRDIATALYEAKAMKQTIITLQHDGEL